MLHVYTILVLHVYTILVLHVYTILVSHVYTILVSHVYTILYFNIDISQSHSVQYVYSRVSGQCPHAILLHLVNRNVYSSKSNRPTALDNSTTRQRSTVSIKYQYTGQFTKQNRTEQ